jgi:hypothetical protein
MGSPRSLSCIALLVAGAVALALLHACQDTPRPTEPELVATAVVRTLTITASGSGDGVVTSNPAGVNCTVTAGVVAGTGCKGQFGDGTVVTLTAVPKTGHSFLQWFGACTGTGTCKLTMTADRTAKARFLRGPFTVFVASGTAGVGTGTVKSQAGLTPAIDCTITNGTPATTGCSGRYPAYTVLTLTATPAPGFVFAGWGAPCSGTGSCQYTVIKGRTIPATFAPGSSTAFTSGKWDAAFPTPVVAVHVHLLPTGKLLLFGHKGLAQLWDPANPGAGFTEMAKLYDFFCSGHTFIANGRLLVTGGTIGGPKGDPRAAVFDGSTGTWSSIGSMAQGRYYPTLTALPDGDVLALSGSNESGAVVQVPEVRHGSTWRRLTTAALAIPAPYYPDAFVAPNGKVFLAGFLQTTRYLDVSGTGTWTPVGDRMVADRKMGSAVMYSPGKILYVGGGDPPTNSAEVIDLNQPAPAWRSVPPMAFARRQLNATLLADGQVLVTHGTSGSGFNDVTNGVHAAELWNPATESWSTLASESKTRTYHSTALLLPDARVLSSGSGEGGGVLYDDSEFTAQIFSPPYLFNPDGSPAARPTISAAPSKISYGQPFTVQTPDPGSVSRGTLIRLSSVTHAFNQSQLLYPVSFTASGATSLAAVGPANANLAVPGPYMLFLISQQGVPSRAKMVTVGP